MDTYYPYMCLCVQQKAMEHGQGANLACFQARRHSLYPNLPNANCKKTFSMWERVLAFRCDDTEASFKLLASPSSFTFTPSSYTFFPLGSGGGFAIPVVVFFFFFKEGLSSDRSLFPGFVSVICGHYINIHGWPEQ